MIEYGHILGNDYLTSVEISGADEMFKYYKDEEALYIENESALQEFVFGTRMALNYIVQFDLHGLEWCPSSPENSFDAEVPSVEELRIALRSMVKAGDITDQQAACITWGDMEEIYKTRGWSMVGLAQERIKSQLYAPQSTPLLPLTRDDFVAFLEKRRAAKCRRMERNASWTELKTHLALLADKIIEKADALQRGETLEKANSDSIFNGIAELLAQMPNRFRRQAFLHCVCGAKEFMRMPVIILKNSDPFTVNPLSIRIPMHVPVASSKVCPTILTWKYPESENWDFELPSKEDEFKTPSTLLDKDLSDLEVASRTGHKVAETFLSLVDQHGPQHVVQEWTNCPSTSDALQTDFKRPINSSREDRHPWYDVIREARAIFENDVSVDNLLKFMGLLKPSDLKKSNELKTDWKYSPSPCPDLPKFKEIFRQIAGQTTPKLCSAKADPSALEIFMGMI